MDPVRQLVRELIDLRRSRTSRLVEIRSGDRTTTKLVVVAGEIVLAESSTAAAPLGRILARRRAITREHQVEVLERMSRASGVHVRFGELCVGLGYALPEDVASGLVAQARSLVVRVLLGNPTWTMRDLPPGRSATPDVPMAIEGLVVEAARWLDGPRKAALGLEEMRLHVLAPVWSFAELVERFELTQEEADFVGVALAGDRTTAELVEQDFGGVDTRAILASLAATGAIASRPRGAHGGNSAPATVRARRPEPPRWALIDLEAAKKAAATVVLAQGGAGSAALADSARSERAFLRARECLRRGDIKRTVEAVDEALAVDPKHAEADLVGQWCRHWLRQDGLAEEAATAFERAARDALADSPDSAFGHFLLGEALQARGQPEPARKHLLQALRLEKELFEGIRDKRLATATNRLPRAHTARAIDEDPALAAAATTFPKESSPKFEVGRALARNASDAAQRSTTLIMKAAPSPPPAALPSAPPPPRRSTSRILVFVLGGFGVIVAGIALGVATAGSDVSLRRDRAVRPPTSSSARAAPPVSVAPTATEPDAAPLTADATAATADAGNASGGGELDAHSGRVRLPSSAVGHRIYVDGRLAGSDVDQVVIPCGAHELRIGSKGAPRTVDVPCGGMIDLR